MARTPPHCSRFFFFINVTQWNIDGIEKGDSLISTEDSGKGELAALSPKVASVFMADRCMFSEMG